jgi:hypothetical protein
VIHDPRYEKSPGADTSSHVSLGKFLFDEAIYIYPDGRDISVDIKVLSIPFLLQFHFNCTVQESGIDGRVAFITAGAEYR